ncbi:MAG: metallophosphoesterase [Clostridia bacterium]|nr:metallophosphoesterase [Clostridia bacterium]
MEITKTEIYSTKIKNEYKIAVVADLHNRTFNDVIKVLEKMKPDYILIPGDLTHNLDKDNSLVSCKTGLSFLEKSAQIAKTYYSVGNHERRVSSECAEFIEQTGAILLDNETAVDGEITFGGLSTGLFENRYGPTPPPDLDYLSKFAKEDGFKLLLCHHPEYYPEYIRETDIDLTVSGHAHGGQWRVFGQGIYAPGQGLFPKYTSGLYEDRLYVSRGLTNTAFPIPRFFNRTELTFIYLKKKDA